MSSAPASVAITVVSPKPYQNVAGQVRAIHPGDSRVLLQKIKVASVQSNPCRALAAAAKSAAGFLPSTLPIVTVLLRLERLAKCGSSRLTQTLQWSRLSDVFLTGGLPRRVRLNAIAGSGLPVSYATTGPCLVQGAFVVARSAGVCRLTASQAGNSDFKPASAKNSFTISAPTETKLSLSCPLQQNAGQPITVSGSLTGAPGGQPVQITYKATGELGQPTLTHLVRTGSSGAYTDSRGAPADATTYSISARYSGDSTHTAAGAVCIVTVTPPPPPPVPSTETLSLTCPQNTIVSGQQIPVSGTLSPAISAAPITVTYTPQNGASTTDTVAADTSGNYQDSAAAANAGSYTISASYPGDSTHTSASATCTITIASPPRATETLTINCAQSGSTGHLVATGTLAPAVANAPITITYAATGQPTTTDSTVANGSGNYTDTGPFGQPSTTYTITATYAGDSIHQPATASCNILPS